MAKLILSLEGSVIREVPLDKERVTIGRKPQNDVQIENLAVIDYHKKAIGSKCGNRLPVLLLAIENGALASSIQNALGFAGLNQSPEHLGLRGIETLDLLPDARQNQLANRHARAVELKSARAAALARGGLILDGECQRHVSSIG